VRMALGATRAQVSLLFVGRTLIPAGIGLISGTCGALLLTRLLRSALYGVEPNSFTVYAISAVLLLFPVLMAALRPALTAGSVNPVEALRAE
jgi:putative ABC transport system permease protein